MPAEAVVGRLQVGRFKRTGLAVSFSYLDRYKEQIMDALEDRYPGMDPDEVYKMLEQGAILAAYEGLIELDNVACQKFVDVIKQVPRSVQCMILGRPEHMDAVRDRLSKN